jgi:hypothetical protein
MIERANGMSLGSYMKKHIWAMNMSDDSGGAGAYGSMVDYQKILHSITVGDGKLLGSDMLEELFKPQLKEAAQAQFNMLLSIKEAADTMTAGIPIGTKMGHALGGAVILEDLDGRRRKGTLNWAGLPNVFWWADRTSGVSGIYGSQVRCREQNNFWSGVVS